MLIGYITPKQLMDKVGPDICRVYLLNEIQRVYKSQGVRINDIHVETIIAQLQRKIKIVNSGTTRFLDGDEVSKFEFEIETILTISPSISTLCFSIPD